MAIDAGLVGVFGALGGVLVGAVAEGVRAKRAFRMEKSWELENERTVHLESIYEALVHFKEVYGLWYANALRVAATNQPSSLKLPERGVPWARLQMLVHFYVPELKACLTEIELGGLLLGSALADAPLTAVQSRERFETAMAPLDHAFAALDKSIGSMREKLVELSTASRELRRVSAGR